MKTTADTRTQTVDASLAAEPSIGYAWYVVIILMVCYTLSFVDRQVLGLLVQPIQQDLGISDTRIGLLGGLAFALFYTFLGMPIGWYADSHSRRNIIVVGVFFWSLMTALCAAARSFWSLFLARMGVGVGEATLAPCAMSIISDYFPKERLGTALSVYGMGIFIGAGLANIVTGAVVQAVRDLPAVTVPILGTIASWRLSFLLVGLPGVLVALLVFTVREPARRNLLRRADGAVSRLSFGEIFQQIGLRWQSVLSISLAMGFQSACNYAMLFWAPTFFVRVHGWTSSQAGYVLGVIILVMGCLGIYAGGLLCDRWQKMKVSEAPLKVGFIGGIGAAITGSLAMLSPSASWTIALLVPTFFFTSLPVGSSYASLQIIFPSQMRGQISAVFLFGINLFGLTLGPLWPGLFNDYLFRSGAMVGYSLAVTLAISGLANAFFYRLPYRIYRIHYRMLHGE